MRRFLKDVASYASELTSATLKGFNDFFFAAADPTALGLIRIAAGLLAFWSLFVLGLDLQDYFGTTGWADSGVVRMLERPFSWSFWFYVPDAWLRPIWFLCLAIVFLFTVGMFSRVTAVLSWVIVVSTVHRLPVALFGFDQVLSVLLLYLAVTGASDQAVSLDHFLKRWRQARAVRRDGPGRSPEGPFKADCRPRWAGRSAGNGFGEPGVATDPDSPGLDLRDGWTGEASGAIVVDRRGPVEDDDDRRVCRSQPDSPGGVAFAHQLLDACESRTRAGIPGARVDPVAAAADGCGHRHLASGDRGDEPGIDRIRVRHDRGESCIRLGPMAAWARRGNGRAAGDRAIRRCLPTLPGFSGVDSGG